ncbi:MAG: hypothetical protein LBM59_04040 [Ruminococcus sp.]|jgi:hypothetical protein|nr:hypothetical protein [Ruminococcus sp.]
MKKMICLIFTLVIILSFPIVTAAKFIENPDGSYVYLIEKGKLAVGFTKIDGYTYYFDRVGRMLTGAYIIGGSHYLFGDDGRMHIGWYKQENGSFSYFLKDGKRATGFIKIGNAFYYFKADGMMLRSGGYLIENKIYTFASDGMVTDIRGKNCLSGYFEESFYELSSRKPSVINSGGDKTMSYATDIIPVALKITGTNAVGIDLYLFVNDKLSGGLRSINGTSKVIPASVLSDDFKSLRKLTKSQSDALFDEFYNECEKKFGKELKNDEIIEVFREELKDTDRIAVFSDKYTVAVVAIMNETVSQLILDKQIISTIN